MKIKKKLICQMPNGTDYGFPASGEGNVEKHAPVTGLFALMRNDETGVIEDNQWHDTFWGICDGIGQNHLGKILMDTRRILRDEKAMTERACRV